MPSAAPFASTEAPEAGASTGVERGDPQLFPDEALLIDIARLLRVARAGQAFASKVKQRVDDADMQEDARRARFLRRRSTVSTPRAAHAASSQRRHPARDGTPHGEGDGSDTAAKAPLLGSAVPATPQPISANVETTRSDSGVNTTDGAETTSTAEVQPQAQPVVVGQSANHAVQLSVRTTASPRTLRERAGSGSFYSPMHKDGEGTVGVGVVDRLIAEALEYDQGMDASITAQRELQVQVEVAEWRQQQAAATMEALTQQVSRTREPAQLGWSMSYVLARLCGCVCYMYDAYGGGKAAVSPRSSLQAARCRPHPRAGGGEAACKEA